jgi:uncharacterized membrane protein YphA (DoxX/SURF4 family)
MRSLLQGNKELWHSPGRRMLLLKITICAALLTALALAPRLWLSDRAFPTIPVHPALPELPQAVSVALLALLTLGVFTVAILPRPRLMFFIVPALGAALVLFDINRLQPWFYQYMLMFLALSLMDWDEPNSPKSKAAWGTCAFILAAIYFWSGIQKANPAFVNEVFPWLASPFAGKQLQPLAYVVPILEATVGILLLFPRTRPAGVLGAIVMHSLLLSALGPLGHNYNSVVWPWNVAMIVMVLALFWRDSDPIVRPPRSALLGMFIRTAVGSLPVLNFVGAWDDYLSASLYSGKSRDAWILLSEEGMRRLPPNVPRTAIADRWLEINRWAMLELNTPPYPELRVYKAVARKLRDAGVPADEMLLYVSRRTGVGRSTPEQIDFRY